MVEMIGLVVLYVACGGVGNVAVCHGMRGDRARLGWVVGGTFVLAAGYIVYAGLLRELPLSAVMPAGAGSYLIIAFMSRLFLKDQVSPLRWVGTWTVATGVLLIMST